MYEKIKNSLEQKDDEITTRIQKIDADKQRSEGPLSADSEERVVELENKEVLDGLDEFSRNELTKIRAALSRIAKGAYGECAVCRERIPIERLEALPYANCCIKCEEESEKAGA